MKTNEIKLVKEVESIEEFLINFSKEIQKHDMKDLIFFNEYFLRKLFVLCRRSSNFDEDSSFIGIPEDDEGTIKTRILFKAPVLELIILRKKIFPNECIMIKYCCKNINDKQYSYDMPSIYGIRDTFILSDS